MTLPDNNLFYQFSFRLYTMSATVFTPNLFSLLRNAELYTFLNRRLNYAIKKTFQKCRFCRNYYFSQIDKSSAQYKPLKLATNIYYLLDSIILASSIENKIKLFKTLYLAAAEPPSFAFPFQITLRKTTDSTLSNDTTTSVKNMSFEEQKQNILELVDELFEYSTEIEAWLDIQFEDEYDDFDFNQPIFNSALEAMASLSALAMVLKDTCEQKERPS